MKRRAAAKRPKQKSSQAGLIHRFGTRLPKPAAESSARVAAWFSDLRPKSVGKSLTLLAARIPALARVLGGIGEASPYLWNAIESDPARLLRLLRADPAESFAALVKQTQAAAA